jgi:hypothetical protein
MITINPPNGRGCGERKKGGIYFCCGVSSGNGLPIEKFILDPAIKWPLKFQRGIKAIKREYDNPNSIVDLIVFVGKQFYKSPWDFIEETRRFGASRRISSEVAASILKQLTPYKSRMVFVHSKAIPDFDYELSYKPLTCNKKKSPTFGYHINGDKCTFSLKSLSSVIHNKKGKADDWFKIELPSLSYRGVYLKIPTKYNNLAWEPGLFLALPLTHIEFCQKANTEVVKNAEKSGFEAITLSY